MTSKCAVLLIILLVELVPHIERNSKGRLKGRTDSGRAAAGRLGVLWNTTDATKADLRFKEYELEASSLKIAIQSPGARSHS
jgi:hypothetical protein